MSRANTLSANRGISALYSSTTTHDELRNSHVDINTLAKLLGSWERSRPFDLENDFSNERTGAFDQVSDFDGLIVFSRAPITDFKPGGDESTFAASTALTSTTTSTTTSTSTTTTTTTSTTATVASSSNPVYADMLAHSTNGVLTYSGALTVLRDAAAQTMTSALFSNLQSAARSINITGGVKASARVQQLFNDVVLGNSANSQWNGGANTAVALGNLSATSTKTQFNELIGKWFLGTDMPGVLPAPGQSPAYATSYQSYSLPLYTTAGPRLTDVNQGQMGDCWFLAAVGETAMLHPDLIRKMITDNGNGAYTVQFQVNGHADYVTVNKSLSTYSTVAQYDGSRMEFANSTTSLWVPLLEKAAAQLAEQTGIVVGMQYPSGKDQYYELSSGRGEGVTLLTGQTCTAYGLGGKSGSTLTSLLGQMHNTLAAGYDVLLGTSGNAVGGNLVASHMFAVTSIDSSTGMVGLYNPWGANSAGAGKAASFSIAASTLVADQANFFAASGATTVV